LVGIISKSGALTSEEIIAVAGTICFDYLGLTCMFG
jgi:hypothetical protein